jgi:transcriptional regulator GlxA family with amidase domain
MSHARSLLAQNALPIRQVAVRVGYPQPAQFAKSFRRYHGQSPSNFRRASHSAALHAPRPATAY